MDRKHFCIIFLILTSLIILTANSRASVDMYLSSPSQTYFSSLGIGEYFTVEVIAEADAPGVTLFAFRLMWSPGGSVEFVHPVSESSPELAMTGFFPPSLPNFSRLSGIAPNWMTPELPGSSGITPEISAFTAPATNYTGPDSLAKITFRKLSSSLPSFDIIDATAAQHLSGSESTPVSVNSYTEYAIADSNNAMIYGSMFSQATAVIINIGGNDYSADVSGDSWTLETKNVAPSLSAQPITIKSMQGGNLLTSITITDFIRSPGWYEDNANHSEHPGDSNGDGVRDTFFDLIILSASYNASVGEDRYDFRSDYNADGIVNLSDFLIFTFYGR